MIKRIVKRAKTHLLLTCYLVALAVYILWGVFCLCFDSFAGERTLSAAAGTEHNAQRLEDGVFLSEGIDPQLVFENVDTPVRTVRLAADFAIAPGEMELFYTRKAGPGFSAQRRVIGAPQADGSYLYTLPPGGVYALRLDLGTAGGNTIAVSSITLNPRMGLAGTLVPNLRVLLGLGLVPALACCVIYTIIEGITALRAFARARRGENGAQNL